MSKAEQLKEAREVRNQARREASPHLTIGNKLRVIDTPGTLPGLDFIVAQDATGVVYAVDPEPLAGPRG